MKRVSLLIVLVFFTLNFYGQIAINTDGSAPDGSAMLDVKSNAKGVLIPRMTSSDRDNISSPATGLVVYVTDGTPGFYYYDGSNWVKLTTANDNDNDWIISGSNMYSGVSGNVGIGTTNPGYKLDVAGTIRAKDVFSAGGKNIIIGDDTYLTDVDQANILGIYGMQNSDRAGIILGSDGSLIFGDNGNVGIGTTSPAYPLTVIDNSADRVGLFISTESSSDNYAVYGECANTDYYGYGGYFRGGYKGVQGVVYPSSNNYYYGVYGYVSGGSGHNYALRGYAYGSGATSYGVYAFGYGGSSGTGYGIAVGGYGNVAYGIYALATTSSSTRHYAKAVSGYVGQLYGLAGYFYNSYEQGTGLVGSSSSNSYYTLNIGSAIAATSDSIGLFAKSTSTNNGTWAAEFHDGNGHYAKVAGTTGSGIAFKILGSGSVSTVVKDTKGGTVTMFATEAPEILFQDYGIGKLINGKAHITLDPIFAKNIIVNNKHPLRVFIQLKGDCNGVYVTNENQYGFDVVELQGGKSNVEFYWTVIANRADEYDDSGKRVSKNADVRFPEAPKPAKEIVVEQDKRPLEEKEPRDPKEKDFLKKK